MVKSKKALIELTASALVVVISFLGTGIYKMYMKYMDSKHPAQQEAAMQELQNKYCNMNNPTPQDQQVCIDILKTRINK